MYTNKYPTITQQISCLHWNHGYGTRHLDQFRLPLARVNVDVNCFLFQAAKLFNGLAPDIRETDKLSKLKNHLYNVYLGSY